MSSSSAERRRKYPFRSARDRRSCGAHRGCLRVADRSALQLLLHRGVNAPEPHRLPVAVAGVDASRLQDVAGDEYRLVQVTRREEGA